MPLYEFECPKGHLTEQFCAVGTKSIVCSCGGRSKKVLSLFTFGRVSSGMAQDDGDIAADYEHREDLEWAIAAGMEVNPPKTKRYDSKQTEPRKFEISKKAEEFKHTGKVPAKHSHLLTN